MEGQPFSMYPLVRFVTMYSLVRFIMLEFGVEGMAGFQVPRTKQQTDGALVSLPAWTLVSNEWV